MKANKDKIRIDFQRYFVNIKIFKHLFRSIQKIILITIFTIFKKISKDGVNS